MKRSVFVIIFQDLFPNKINSFLIFQEAEDQFTSLQYALFIMCFIEVVGAALFFVTSFYVVRDKQNVDLAIHGELLIRVPPKVYNNLN